MKETCNYCFKNMGYRLNHDGFMYYVCITPECPAFSFFQVPAEKMKEILSREEESE